MLPALHRLVLPHCRTPAHLGFLADPTAGEVRIGPRRHSPRASSRPSSIGLPTAMRGSCFVWRSRAPRRSGETWMSARVIGARGAELSKRPGVTRRCARFAVSWVNCSSAGEVTSRRRL